MGRYYTYKRARPYIFAFFKNDTKSAHAFCQIFQHMLESDNYFFLRVKPGEIMGICKKRERYRLYVLPPDEESPFFRIKFKGWEEAKPFVAESVNFYCAETKYANAYVLEHYEELHGESWEQRQEKIAARAEKRQAAALRRAMYQQMKAASGRKKKPPTKPEPTAAFLALQTKLSLCKELVAIDAVLLKEKTEQLCADLRAVFFDFCQEQTKFRPVECAVLMERLLAIDRPIPLQILGERYNFSRERIRQIQEKLSRYLPRAITGAYQAWIPYHIRFCEIFCAVPDKDFPAVLLAFYHFFPSFYTLFAKMLPAAPTF